MDSPLVTRTVTVGQPTVELISTRVNWTSSPPIVYLSVRTQNNITPKQVRLVQEFISKEMEQPFRLVFLVSEVKQVTPEEEGEAETPVPPLLRLDSPQAPILPRRPKK